MLIGSASRYIAGRAAVQTVYWRSQPQGSGKSITKMIKTGRFFNLGNKGPLRNIPETKITLELQGK